MYMAFYHLKRYEEKIPLFFFLAASLDSSLETSQAMDALEMEMAKEAASSLLSDSSSPAERKVTASYLSR